MSTSEQIPYDQLSAFVDGELDAVDQGSIYQQMREDPSLNHAICELQRIKGLLLLAYQVPRSRSCYPTSRNLLHNYLTNTIVVILLSAISATGGWLIKDSQTPMQSQSTPVHQFPTFDTVLLDTVTSDQSTNVIIHLSTNDPFKLAHALSETEQMLNQFKEIQRDLRVEIVANGNGLELLRTSTSLFPEKTQQIIMNFDNVTIMACGNSLKILEVQGIDTRLLPNVQTTKSVLDKVIKRLQEGWMYLKV